jgi:hypothetical protein
MCCSKMFSRNRGVCPAAAFLALGAALLCSGCASHNVHAAVPATVQPSASLPESGRPMTTAPDTDAAPPVEVAAAPPSVTGAAGAPPPLPAVRSAPALRKPAETATAEVPAEPPVRTPAPQISPQLSAGDQASYERKTTEDAAVAEKNIQNASGRQLNAAQQDIVDKVRSFLSQARDAGKAGDWARAQNLAQKARALSVELSNSP